MIPDLPWVLAMLGLGPAILFLMMLLPSFLELKRPRDAGPRMIMEDIAGVTQTVRFEISFISSLEEEESQVKLAPQLVGVLSVFPNIDV